MGAIEAKTVACEQTKGLRQSMRVRILSTFLSSSRVLGLGWALAWTCLTPEICRSEAPTTNAFALTLHATVVPEIHIVPPDERGASSSPADPFSFATGTVSVAGSSVSNRNSFAIHARNLTMLEAIDLICFLSDTSYAFDGNRLVIGSTNVPPVELKQSEKRERALVDKMKGMTIPEITFRPPATILDAAEFFFQASADYDEKEVAGERRGINFAVKSPDRLRSFRPRPDDGLPIISAQGCSAGGRPELSALSARFCTLYEGLSNVCDRVYASFVIRDNTVVICPAPER